MFTIKVVCFCICLIAGAYILSGYLVNDDLCAVVDNVQKWNMSARLHRFMLLDYATY